MKRREFNRMGLGSWANSIAGRSLSCTVVRRIVAAHATSTAKIQYRHQAFPAAHTPGERATESPAAGVDLQLLDVEATPGGQSRCDRIGQSFFNMTEVRRVAWPNYETPEYSEKAFFARNRRNA